MTLEPITPEVAEWARVWRNAARETLRTPYLLTHELQMEWFNSLQDRNSPHRYWQIYEYPMALGVGGLTNIQWENRIAEISLIISPTEREKGYGREAVNLILHEGFANMNLNCIFGEAYTCNPGWQFWERIANGSGAFSTLLPDRKYWNGEYWQGFYFSFRPSTAKRIRIDMVREAGKA